MLRELTDETAARFAALCDETTCTGLRMAAALACRDARDPARRFYLVDDTAALCLEGRHALLCGFVPDAEELASFFALNGIESFTSESMLFAQVGWQPDAQLLMRFGGSQPDVYAAEVDAAPDMWRLAHSPALAGHDPDAWYAQVCAYKNRGLADIRAVAQAGQYVATAGIYALRDAGAYLSGVQTAKEWRGQGFASTLVSGLCRSYGAQTRPLWLLCRPALRGFYEALGFALAAPVCAWRSSKPNE